MKYKHNQTPLQRFLSYVLKTPDCWLWTGGKTRKGYSQFHHDAAHGMVRAHRFAYEMFKGPIPKGLVIDHLCGVTDCVNPDHLEAVSSRENTLRSGIAPAAIHSRQTYCIRGHPLSGENLYIQKSKGGRYCRTCARAALRRFREKADGL